MILYDIKIKQSTSAKSDKRRMEAQGREPFPSRTPIANSKVGGLDYIKSLGSD